MPGAKFLLLKTNQDVSDYRTARELLRYGGSAEDRLLDVIRKDTSGSYSAGSFLLLPTEVLLMIGNTPELLPAAEEAERAGLREIRRANRDAQMSCYAVRIQISAFQTDTLLAIGTTEYFQNHGFARDWFPIDRGATDFNCVRTGHPSTEGSLRWVIQQCKNEIVQLKPKE